MSPRDSNEMQKFGIDKRTGELKETGTPTILSKIFDIQIFNRQTDPWDFRIRADKGTRIRLIVSKTSAKLNDVFFQYLTNNEK